MEIQIQPVADAPEITTVRIHGRIDSYTVERVEEELGSLIRIGNNRIVCELQEVEFVAGPGLKCFLKTIQAAREQGGDVKLCGLRPEVEKMFRLSGFTKIATLFTGPRDALASFGVRQANISGEWEKTMLAGGGDLDATLIPGASSADIGMEQTMIPGAPSSAPKDIDFAPTMIPGVGDHGLGATLIDKDNADGIPNDLRSKLAAASHDAPAPEVDACDALKSKLQGLVFADTIRKVDSATAMTILDQIDQIEAEAGVGTAPADDTPPPAKAEARDHTRVIQVERPTGELHEPKLQPVLLYLPNQDKYLNNLSQLVGALGTLGGVNTMKMVKFGVCVVESARALMLAMKDGHSLKVRIDAGENRIAVRLTAPLKGIDFFESLRPKMDSSVQSADAARAWLDAAVSSVEVEAGESDLRVTLCKE